MQHPKFYGWHLTPTSPTRPRARRHPRLVAVERLPCGTTVYRVRFGRDAEP